MCLRVVAIKGFAMLPGIVDAVLADPSEVEPVVDQLAIDGLVSNAAGALKLTDAGAERVAGLLMRPTGRPGAERRRTPPSTRSSRSTTG